MAVNHTGRFDRRLAILRESFGTDEVPHVGVVDAAIFVNDTMELAEMIADEVLGDKMTAEAVVAIYDRIDRERLRLAATNKPPVDDDE